MISPALLDEQEAAFARAFAAADLSLVRERYDPEVVYLSPTVRLYGWPQRIDGVDRTLEFIGLTILNCDDIRYEAVERVIAPDGATAFVRIHFDWTDDAGRRLRSNYVVVYRYRGALISQQELYYDPSAPLEVLGEIGTRGS